jgi:hypothetical protein
MSTANTTMKFWAGAVLGLALSVAGCFSEEISLGLPCTESEQCGNGQVCDLGTARCVLDGEEETGGSGTDLPPVEPCNTDGTFRCAPTGPDIQACDSGVWTPISCDDACAGGKAGACVDDGSGAQCLCADGIGGECEGFVPQVCTEGGQIEFCLEGQIFRNDCSSACGIKEYPVAGPCVDPDMNGAYCVCADNEASMCSLSQEFMETCAGPATASVCVDGTEWEIDCAEQCTRFPGGDPTCTDGRCGCIDG